MDRLLQTSLTGALGKATLAAGTTSTVSTTGALAFAIRGKAYSSAALANAATPTTDVNTGAAFAGVKRGFGSVFVYGFNAAGTLLCAQGEVIALDLSGVYTWRQKPQLPALPDDFCPIGALTILALVAADLATGWIQGTSNQAAVTGITYARTDFALGMPDQLI